MTERFIIDDAGTLIDMSTRNTYDYVSDVCGLLNELHEENQILRHELLCKQLDKAPTEPINCKCHYEVKE